MMVEAASVSKNKATDSPTYLQAMPIAQSSVHTSALQSSPDLQEHLEQVLKIIFAQIGAKCI